MTRREVLLLRMAMTHLIANFDDFCDASQDDDDEGSILYNGATHTTPTEEELMDVLARLDHKRPGDLW
jgi:hypothetical protein